MLLFLYLFNVLVQLCARSHLVANVFLVTLMICLCNVGRVFVCVFVLMCFVLFVFDFVGLVRVRARCVCMCVLLCLFVYRFFVFVYVFAFVCVDVACLCIVVVVIGLVLFLVSCLLFGYCFVSPLFTSCWLRVVASCLGGEGFLFSLICVVLLFLGFCLCLLVLFSLNSFRVCFRVCCVDLVSRFVFAFVGLVICL